jgi:hypothetical protein
MSVNKLEGAQISFKEQKILKTVQIFPKIAQQLKFKQKSTFFP